MSEQPAELDLEDEDFDEPDHATLKDRDPYDDDADIKQDPEADS